MDRTYSWQTSHSTKLEVKGRPCSSCRHWHSLVHTEPDPEMLKFAKEQDALRRADGSTSEFMHNGELKWTDSDGHWLGECRRFPPRDEHWTEIPVFPKTPENCTCGEWASNT